MIFIYKGLIDVPEMIDYVLNATKQTDLFYVGSVSLNLLCLQYYSNAFESKISVFDK